MNVQENTSFLLTSVILEVTVMQTVNHYLSFEVITLGVLFKDSFKIE